MTTMQSFDVWMKSTQAEMEVALVQHLPPVTVTPARLHEAMHYAVLDGGKRVRPLLVYAAGALFDADAAELARAAAAVEMIHAYSLVHDDMPCMDDDALQSQAFEVLADGGLDPVRQLAMVRLLAKASGSLGMCGGQAIDLASVGLSLSLQELEQMHRLKTGALLRVSVLLGALAGKALSAEETQALDTYAAAIGLAFQVVDDVLDATADSATLGKTAGKDAADNKPTYVSILGLEQSQALAEKLRNDAHRALEQFGEKARRLRELADLIVQRKA